MGYPIGHTRFNSRSRMGSDRRKLRTKSCGNAFQFTLPHGERRVRRPQPRTREAFQFTLPHGERPGKPGLPLAPSLVSIHAPAWGATFVHLAFSIPSAVSIHAPAWGATHPPRVPQPKRQFQFTLPHGERLCTKAMRVPSVAFQFTLPHGERLGALALMAERDIVSIHAPAWGATGRRPAPRRGGTVSIHAPAWGAT